MEEDCSDYNAPIIMRDVLNKRDDSAHIEAGRSLSVIQIETLEFAFGQERQSRLASNPPRFSI